MLHGLTRVSDIKKSTTPGENLCVGPGSSKVLNPSIKSLFVEMFPLRFATFSFHANINC